MTPRYASPDRQRPQGSTIENAANDTLIAMAIGLVVGLGLLAAAIFHDVLFGIAASGGRRVVRRASVLGSRASSASRRTLAVLGRSFGRSAVGRQSKDAASQHASSETSELADDRETDEERGAAIVVGEARTWMDDQDVPIEQPGPAVEPSQPTQKSRAGLTARHYEAPSAIAIEGSVTAFLEERGGQASVDALVRHLDRAFGAGIGMGLIEGLRSRGVVEVRRETAARVQLTVLLRRVRSGERPGS